MSSSSPPLTNINGVSISEIENRAVPLPDNTEDKERCRVRSSGGFLDPGESFLDRLAIDSQKVTDLGTTHQTLAENLGRLLTEASSERKKSGLGPNAKVLVDFSYQAASTELNRMPTSIKPQRLLVSHRNFMGAQWSFFRNLDPNHSPTFEDEISWKEDHEVANQAFPTVVITVAGGAGTGICHYISKYGFYEGGKTNPYRIDPSVLHWVLTGQPTRRAIESLIETYRSLQSLAKDQLDAQMADFKLATDLSAESLASLEEYASSSYQSEFERAEALISPLLILLNSIP